MPLLGKVSARALDERSYRTQRYLWRNGFDSGSPDGISVAEPVGKLPELRMWLQRRVGGQPAWPSACRAQRSAHWVRRVAAAVHKLHSSGASDRAHGVTDELSILRERLGALARLRPSLASRIDRVLTGCARLAATLLPRTPRAAFTETSIPTRFSSMTTAITCWTSISTVPAIPRSTTATTSDI
jgi:hypothetical protein